jgi:glutathione synthase/RimK-type ligase-like ATP-grasp enzyme
MRVAFCTNIPPVADPSSLRGRNHAIIEQIKAAGHAVDVLYGPEDLLRGRELPPYEMGMLCPNDLVEAVPDPLGRARAEIIAMALERTGVRFVNSPLLRRFSTNKLLTHVAFRSAGLPQPAAWTPEEMDDLRPWPHDGLVVKPVTGSGGLGVSLARSPEDALARLSTGDDLCFVQQFVPDARCIRVVATQEESLGRYEKRVPRGTVVAGISSGAEEVKLSPRADLDELAVAMTRAVAMDIVGVDILEAADGRLFALEVNVNFGFYPRNGEILDGLVSQLGPAVRGSVA